MRNDPAFRIQDRTVVFSNKKESLGIYNSYYDPLSKVEVQLKVGIVTMSRYAVGETVTLPDGVYLGVGGVVVIEGSQVHMVHKHVIDKWGNAYDPGTLISHVTPPVQILED